ncbi:MAG: pseudouridine-5'-phosphate glycosidase [Candidatus Limnocylindrales bacterium]
MRRGPSPPERPAAPLAVSAEVRAALAAGRPVVALESTLITHGLAAPLNLEVARASEAAVRREGAVPATIAIRGGRLLVGLSDNELALLAAATGALKASRHNLAAALGSTRWAGTTVSATMIAAHLAGISVLATGGIGGVHRGGATSMDISADLAELARTPVLVVCAGPKSILDAALTLEVLETHGVPVVGLATDELPGFFSRSSGLRLHMRVETPVQAAALARRHWALGLGSGIVVTTPVPAESALGSSEAGRAIERATAEAEAKAVHGPAATPWILARVAELTEGRSTTANVALIEHDATIGARIAVALAASAAA